MNELLSLAQNVVELGLIFSLVVLSMHITSRIIGFDDLTVTGSFGIGGAISAQLLIMGVNPWLSLPLVVIAGCTLGLCTGLLHTKLNMNNLISGIVVTTAVFSISLKIAGPNIALGHTAGLFDISGPPFIENIKHLLLIAPIVLIIFTGIRQFLQTQIGFMLKAVGDNPQMLTNLGKNTHMFKILGLVIGNGITALAGALFVQHTGFFSITGNIDTIIIALAGLILSASIARSSLFGLILGSIAFQTIKAMTIELQLDPSWNQLIAAVLIVVLIISRKVQKQPTLWR